MSDYWKDGEPNWRRLEAMARRKWARFAAGAEAGEGWQNMGGGLRIGRMLASGDLRLVALYLIEQQPRHGYDIIKAVEEKSAGFYVPSPGVVYPALTFLEEAGYVTSQADGNKKLYAITDEGRAHLESNRKAIETTLAFLAKAGEQMHRFRDFAQSDWFGGDEPTPEREGFGHGRRHGREHGHGPGPERDRDLKDVVPELNEARKALKAALRKARHADESIQHEAAAILREAARRIEALGEDEIDI